MDEMKNLPLPSGTIPMNLHHCSECGSNLVQPIEDSIEEIDESHFQMTIRCPNCELHTGVVAPNSDCYAFDDELEDGDIILRDQLRRMAAANFAEEIERFVALLEDDRILPFDF